MSNSQWHEDQTAGELMMRSWDAQRKDEEKQAAIALEIRELLSAFIDAQVLRGHALSPQQWERACFLCGRWCPPFVDRQLTGDDQ
jgi:hypothetical protein